MVELESATLRTSNELASVSDRFQAEVRSRTAKEEERKAEVEAIMSRL